MLPLCTSWVTSSFKGKLQDPAKVQAVAEWPTPSSRKELEVLQTFTKGLSGITARLIHPFQWTPEAAAAFSRLKTLFTCAPVLKHPDPALQFIVVGSHEQ